MTLLLFFLQYFGHHVGVMLAPTVCYIYTQILKMVGFKFFIQILLLMGFDHERGFYRMAIGFQVHICKKVYHTLLGAHKVQISFNHDVTKNNLQFLHQTGN